MDFQISKLFLIFIELKMLKIRFYQKFNFIFLIISIAMYLNFILIPIFSNLF